MGESIAQIAFIGREDELSDARSALRTVPVLAVEGEAGIGKTAFLREIASELVTENPERAILWVDTPESGDFSLLLYQIGVMLSEPGRAIRERTLSDLRYWVTSLINDVNAVVIVEDIHRIKSPQLEIFLRSVSSHLGKGRLLLSTRESLEIPVKADGALPWVTLGRLDPADCRALVEHVYHSLQETPPSPEQLEQALPHLDGLPERVLSAAVTSLWARLPFSEAALTAKAGDIIDMLVVRLSAADQKAMGILALAGVPLSDDVLQDLMDGKAVDTSTHVWNLLTESRPDGRWMPYCYRAPVRHGVRVGQRLQIHDKLNNLYWSAFQETNFVEQAMRSIEHALEAGRPGDAADRFEKVLPMARKEGLHRRILDAARRIPDRMQASRPRISGGLYYCKAFLGDQRAAERLEATLEQAPTDQREGLCVDLATLKRAAGDTKKALYFRGRALEEAKRRDDPLATLIHTVELADLNLVVRDYEMAKYLLQGCPELFLETELDDPAVEGKYFESRGLLALREGDIKSAEKDLGRAKLSLEEAMAFREVGQVDLRVAMYYYGIGDWRQARSYFDEALASLKRSGDRIDAASVEIAIADLRLLAGDKTEAGKLITGVSELIRSEEKEYVKALEPALIVARGKFARHDGDYLKYREALQEAVVLYEELGNPGIVANLKGMIMTLCAMDGNYFRSRDLLRKMPDVERSEEKLKLPEHQERMLADAYAAYYRAQYAKAREFAETVRRFAQQSRAYMRIVNANKVLVMCALAQHQFSLLEDYLKAMRKGLIDDDRLTPIWADCYEALAYCEQGETDRAKATLERLEAAAGEIDYQGMSAYWTYVGGRIAAAEGRLKDASTLAAEAYDLARKGQSLFGVDVGFFAAAVEKARGIPGAGERYRRDARLITAHRPDLKVIGLKVEETVRGYRWKAPDRLKVRQATIELPADTLQRLWLQVQAMGFCSRGQGWLVTPAGVETVFLDYRDFVAADAYTLVIDGPDFQAFLGTEVIALDSKRLLHHLLCHLARTANQPQSTEKVFAAVWGEKYEGAESESRLETQLKRLRQLLGGPEGAGAFITTYSDGRLGLDPAASWCLFDADESEKSKRLNDLLGAAGSAVYGGDAESDEAG